MYSKRGHMKCECVSFDNYLFQIYFFSFKLRAHSKTSFINVHIFIYKMYKKIKFASSVILKDSSMYQPCLKLVLSPKKLLILLKAMVSCRLEARQLLTAQIAEVVYRYNQCSLVILECQNQFIRKGTACAKKIVLD